MGLPDRIFPSPSEFLRKKCGIRHQVKSDSSKQPPSKRLTPVIPTVDLLKEDRERRKKLPPEKNFVRVNVDNALNLKPKVPEERIVIRKDGLTKKMSAGMEPVYIFKETFGRMPQYLKRFIKEREKNVLMKKDVTEIEHPKCRYVIKEEREQLLKGLKENWEELQKKYQGLPILTDSIAKVHRKLKLEEELKQLEKDIVLIEKHPYIYVYEDNDLTSN
ncbi:hypothetical protein RN001_010232 [Aquatica leii]|uniref:Enkurin domain-containing protein n=1 Tax=Aquatica leii TaxID=1421715 RepID=A0AAN7S8H4_9COLE|nr:hypothetical protein RN001_010232 [Aquatica leii]